MSRSVRLLGAAVLGALTFACPAAAAVHTVVPGETLSGHRRRQRPARPAPSRPPTACSPDRRWSIAGTTLRVPATRTAGRPSRWRTAHAGARALGGGHVVRPGETLSGIAAANGLTHGRARPRANGLSPTRRFVIAGTTAADPRRRRRRARGRRAAGGERASRRPLGGYVVQAGRHAERGLALRSRVPIAADRVDERAAARRRAARRHVAASCPTGSPVLASGAGCRRRRPSVATCAPWRPADA